MIATVDLAVYIRHRWRFMHLFRNLRNIAWLDDSRASYADWAADERRELLACLKERRKERGTR